MQNGWKGGRLIQQIAGLTLATALMTSQAFAQDGTGTLLRFDTTYGHFTVELYDNEAPQTVANFLGYVDRGDFNGSVVHRSVEDFVVQAGAYRWLGDCPGNNAQPGVNCSAQFVPQQSPVVNEPGISNVRGTLAMAKREGDPNSATSQWFINLSDNSENLDNQNGGFTVFGKVLGEGLNVADSINSLSVYSVGGEAQTMPLRSFQGSAPVTEQLILMNPYRVQRFSAALNVFETANGGLSVSFNSEQLGRLTLRMKLVDEQQLLFEVLPESIIPLAQEPVGLGTYNADEQRLFIPELELNNNGSVTIVRNIEMRMVDETRLRFAVESYQ